MRAPALVPSSLQKEQMRFSQSTAPASKGPLIFVAVFTTFDEPAGCANATQSASASPASASVPAADTPAARRDAARSGWMSDPAARSGAMVVRFVAVTPSTPEGTARMEDEQRQHSDIWVLPPDDAKDDGGVAEAPGTRAGRPSSSRHLVAEGESAGGAGGCAAGGSDAALLGGLATPKMLRRYLARAAREHGTVEYMVHMDDSAFLLPQRLLCVADQWAAMGADYVGCMLYDKVTPDDPLAFILAPHYPLHAAGGGPVAVSARAVRDIVVLGYDTLRLTGRGDVVLALWIMTSNTTYYDDRRLCQVPPSRPRCGPAAVALYNPGRGGLAAAQLAAFYDQASCRAPPTCPLPYVQSRLPPVESYMAPLRV